MDLDARGYQYAADAYEHLLNEQDSMDSSNTQTESSNHSDFGVSSYSGKKLAGP